MRKTKKKSLFSFTHGLTKLNNSELTNIYGGCCGDPDDPDEDPPKRSATYQSSVFGD